MDRHTRRTPLANPAAERTTDQSTQTTGGLGGGRNDPGPNVEHEDVINRDPEARDTTPRRYDVPDDNETALPSNDATLRTEI